MGKEVVLRTFTDRYQADMAKGLLDEKGVKNMISDEDVGGFHPGMIVRECSLIVNEEDLARAREVIKIMAITFSLLLSGTVLGFTDYIQGPNTGVLMQERVNEKMTFDRDLAVYNDKANTQIRAKDLVKKKTERNDQENKKVQDEQDQTKGQILLKF